MIAVSLLSAIDIHSVLFAFLVLGRPRLFLLDGNLGSWLLNVHHRVGFDALCVSWRDTAKQGIDDTRRDLITMLSRGMLRDGFSYARRMRGRYLGDVIDELVLK